MPTREVVGRIDLSSGVTLRASTTIEVREKAGLPKFSDLYGTNPDAHMVTIDQPVLLDIDAHVNGLTITPTGDLIFPPDTSRTLYSHGHSVMVDGRLTQRPAHHGIVHRIAFRDIDENAYLGGAVGDHHSDPGLMIHGTWDAIGSERTPWTNLTEPATARDTSIAVADTTGWQIGDEISVAPTEPATVTGHETHTEYRRIKDIGRNLVTLDQPLTWPHPFVTAPDGQTFRPEVVNYTRNVQVEGDTDKGQLGATATTGRAHIMFMGGRQTIRNVAVRHMGPRQPTGEKNYTEGVLGRYGFHFHRCGEATRGTLIENVVIRQTGFRGIVPHASHGITIRGCVVDQFHDDGYWWDIDTIADKTDDLIYDRCIASNGKGDPDFRGNRISGFLAAAGGLDGKMRPTMRGCVAYGMRGGEDAAGFHWPETLGGSGPQIGNLEWVFADCIGHNNRANGIFVWQNNHDPHRIENAAMFNNGHAGADHGAYGNSYQYVNPLFFGNGGADLEQHSVSKWSNRTVEPLTYTGGWIGRLVVKGHRTPFETEGTFRGVRIGSVEVNEVRQGTQAAGLFDFIDCGLTPDRFSVLFMHPLSVIRVQQDGRAWRLTAAAGFVPIAPFAS